MKKYKKMKKLITALVGVSVMAGCGQGSVNVDFKEGANYFVRNDVEEVPLVLNSEAERDSVLGMAAVMGDGGLPTEIDFSKESVINIALPETNCPTDLHVKSVVQKGDSLIVSYEAMRQEECSYTMRPYTMVIVSKSVMQQSPKVRLEEVK